MAKTKAEKIAAIELQMTQLENLYIDFSKNNQNKKCKKVSCSNTSSSCAS